MSTWSDLFTDSLTEIGAYGIEDMAIEAEDAQRVTRYANRLLDSWAALKRYAYATSFQLFTLTPGHAPHLIGPGLASPVFAWPVRPTRIESASLVLNNQSPPVDSPALQLRDAAWWHMQRVKSLQSNVPTDLYYEPDFPNGALNFWPNPNYPYAARLELWTVLGQIPLDANGNPDLTQTFTAPQGYELAFCLSLSELLVTPYSRPMPAELPGRAAAARAALQSNNTKSPRISSTDFGVGKSAGGFNWTTGMPS